MSSTTNGTSSPPATGMETNWITSVKPPELIPQRSLRDLDQNLQTLVQYNKALTNSDDLSLVYGKNMTAPLGRVYFYDTGTTCSLAGKYMQDPTTAPPEVQQDWEKYRKDTNQQGTWQDFLKDYSVTRSVLINGKNPDLRPNGILYSALSDLHSFSKDTIRNAVDNTDGRQIACVPVRARVTDSSGNAVTDGQMKYVATIDAKNIDPHLVISSPFFSSSSSSLSSSTSESMTTVASLSASMSSVVQESHDVDDTLPFLNMKEMDAVQQFFVVSVTMVGLYTLFRGMYGYKPRS